MANRFAEHAAMLEAITAQAPAILRQLIDVYTLNHADAATVATDPDAGR